MSRDRWSRREFVSVAAGAAATLGAGGVASRRAGDPRSLSPLPNQATPAIRRNVYRLDTAGPELTAYRQGITQMKAWSAANPNDPRGWTYQAAIHGTYASPTQPAWNTCPHHSYYFFTWHRAFLYYFERIVRAASGVPSFGLPYWNYSIEGQRQLPAPFRDSADALFLSGRTLNGGAEIDHNTVNYVGDFAPTLFSSTLSGTTLVARGFGGASRPTISHFDAQVYGGTLEIHVHDLVHGAVGGAMGDVNQAAIDPIFWLHHANIDRLWNRWLEYQQPGSGRDDPRTDTQWMTATFSFFDETGAPVTIRAQDVLDNSGLSYRYDDDPCPTAKIIVFPYKPRPWIVIDCVKYPFLCPKPWNPRLQDPWKVLSRYAPPIPIPIGDGDPAPLPLRIDPRGIRDLRRLLTQEPEGRALELVLDFEHSVQLPILAVEAQVVGATGVAQGPWVRLGQAAFFDSAEERKARPREQLQIEITEPLKELVDELTEGKSLRWRVRFVSGAVSRAGRELPPNKAGRARIHAVELRVR